MNNQIKINENIRKTSSALQKVPENELSINFIKPLFEKLGCFKVEFYGGTDEEGKDLLFWEKDKLGELRLSVAQVKHFKFTNKSSGGKSFQTIVNQLSTSLVKEVHYSDKSVHLPIEVYLISSHEIDSKNIKSKFSLNHALNNRAIRIIDGIRLAELLIENCPEIISKLINEEIDFSHFSSKTLTNNILLKALGFHNEVSLKSIYTDIDFSLGKSSTKLFFDKEFIGSDKKYLLKENQWINLKSFLLGSQDYLQKLILKNEIEIIEKNHELIEKELEKWNIKYENLKNTKSINENKLKLLYDKFKSEISKNNKLLIKLQFLDKKKKLTKEEISNKKVINKEVKALTRIISPITRLEKHDKKLSNEIVEFENEKPDPVYHVSINGAKIGNWLNRKRKEIQEKLKVFNEHSPSQNELKCFMQECHEIFKSSSTTLNIPVCSKSLNLDNNVIRTNYESNRFKLPINKVFDTGVNLTLLGEAGAGKTTSLQMYALENIDSNDKIVIWAPLSQVVQNWSLRKKHAYNKEKIEAFDHALCEYLNTKNVNISNAEFKQLLFSKKKVLILFDGLDESIRSNDWLPDAINFMAKKFKDNIQIIVTSRMFGTYIEKLDFFAVTLLPFTKIQRNQFIDKWFNNSDTTITDGIKKHLSENKSIDEVTRNPLLTTTLCVLAKHDLPLPQTEIKLYSDRLRLLTGYYDSVKNISRITTTPQNLEVLSKKIAYYLHSKNIREKDFLTLEKLSIDFMKNILNEEGAKKALSELINPCNILVPMSDTGEYGFGHLRYQEHLAALELNSNRNLIVLPLLKSEWWRETIQLFVQMCDDISWLINEVGHRIQMPFYRELIRELIEFRPKNEWKSLNQSVSYFEKDILELNEMYDQIDEDLRNNLFDGIESFK